MLQFFNVDHDILPLAFIGTSLGACIVFDIGSAVY